MRVQLQHLLHMQHVIAALNAACCTRLQGAHLTQTDDVMANLVQYVDEACFSVQASY